ncbi:MAG TPA: glycosyltransferase family 39 protein [bacterium]|nr:glycosyltransferase family 39 protein [bacterium]
MRRYTGLTLIIVIAAALRFALLGHNSLWDDEAFVAHAIQKGWHDLIVFLAAHDNHPPLYFALIKAWTGIAGTGEAALRAPSAMFGVVSVPLTYAIMRRLSGDRAARIAALFVAVSPFEVMAGQNARMYTLLEMLTLASTLLLILPTRRLWHSTAYVGTAAAMMYTHYLGFVVLAAHGIWTAWRDRRRLMEWAIGAGVAGILFIPWMPYFFDQVVKRHVWGWIHPLLDVGGLFAFGGSLFGLGGYILWGTRLSLVQVVAVLPFVSLAALGARGMGLPTLILVLPIGAMAAVSLIFPAFYPRWFSFVFPFYAMLLTSGVLRIAPRRAVAAVLVAAVIACNVPVLDRYYLDPSFRPWNWRGAATYVRGHFQPHDLLIFIGDNAMLPFTYYFSGDVSLTVTPMEATGRSANFFSYRVREIAAQHPRLWVMSTVVWQPQLTQRLIPMLLTSYHMVRAERFSGADVYLFEVSPAAGARQEAMP